MTRVGAVDIGTNSTRLLVGDVRRSVVTQLGEGVDANRRLSDAGMQRVLAVLDEFRKEIGDAPTTAVATSAVRDSANGEEFMREVAERYGWQTRVLTGDEEAELTRRGVRADDRTLVLDVGGGSTELILGPWHTSLDVGSRRLTERHLHSDPPTAEELEAAAAETRGLLPDLKADEMIGVAGTAAQLHELAGDLTLEAVEAQLERLAAMPLAERSKVPGLDPARAPVIVAGALIVREALRRYGLRRLEFSERDILDGIAGIVADSTSFDQSVCVINYCGGKNQ